MKQNQIAERPQLLTWGILLMAAKSAFFLLLLTIGMVAVPVVFGIGAVEARGDDAVPIVLVGMLAEFVVFLLAALQLFSLYACRKAWDRSRTWLIILMVLAGLSVFDSSIVGIIIAGMTIIGGVQALERSKELDVAGGPEQAPGPEAQPTGA
jgi:hypothetical protein